MLRDLRLAVRSLSKRPALAWLATLTLALGIGANTAIFSVVYGVLLRPLPYPDAARLVEVASSFPGEAADAGSSISFPDFADLLEGAPAFERGAAWTTASGLALDGTDGAARLQANLVGAGYFDVLGARASSGRLFAASDHAPGAGMTAVISESAWQQFFGGDPAIVGRDIRLNGHAVTILGVLPASFPDASIRRNQPVDVWVPIEHALALIGQPDLRNRSGRLMWAVARLAPGATIETARAQAKSVAARLDQAYPDTNRGFGLTVHPLEQRMFGDVRRPLFLLLGGAAFVLLIACANVSNLLLVRSSGRVREVAIRRAIGASSIDVARPLVAEGLVLAGAGAVAGITTAAWITPALLAAGKVALPSFVQVGIDLTVLAACAALATVCGVVTALVPSFRAARLAVRDALVAESTPNAAGPGRSGRWLIAIETGAAMVLLAGGLLMTRSFTALTSTTLGFDSGHLLTMRLDLPAERYATPAARARAGEALLDEIRDTTGIEGAVLWGPSMFGRSTWISLLAPEGRAINGPDDLLMAWRHSTNPGALATLGIRLDAGRDFDPQDRADHPAVVIISRSLAERFWPGQDAVGRRLVTRIADGSLAPLQVIGVAADANHRGRFRFSEGSLAHDPQLDIYYPYAQRPNAMLVLGVRTSADDVGVVGQLRRAVAQVDPSLPAYDIVPLSDRLRDEEAAVGFASTLMGLYAVLALALAAAGTGGVLAFAVAARSRELGIKLALGAAPRQLIRDLLREGLASTAIGGAAGLAVVAVLQRTVAGLLFGVTAMDPIAIGGALAVLLLASALASYLPARRITRLNPASALTR